MQHINTVFSQLLTEIPRYEFNKVVNRYHGDKREGSMSCWTQFCAMLYGQLSGRKPLREISLTWESHRLILALQKPNVRHCLMPIENALRGFVWKYFIGF